MAALRTVDPTLQLDVDTLILEYLLHQAIKAQFRILNNTINANAKGTNGLTHHDTVEEEEAQRLLNSFDASIRLLRELHPQHNLNDSTRFNVVLLEILVLLRSIEGHATDNDQGSLSEDDHPPVTNIAEEMATHKRLRRAWYDHRYLINDSQRTQETDAEESVMSRWNQATLSDPRGPGSGSEVDVSLFRVLNRFMLLSAEISPHIGAVNEIWMQLAGELMLQSALQILSASTTATPQRDSYGLELADCFSFGFLPSIVRVPAQHQAVFTATNEIFGDFASSSSPTPSHVPDNQNNDSPTPPPTTESPFWTGIRRSLINEFRVPRKPAFADQDTYDTVFTQRVARLRHKYPLDPLEQRLTECLENYWILNCSKDDGKPVLVQIEEGGLKGLNGEEFERFMMRVGLRDEDQEGEDGDRAVDLERRRERVERFLQERG